MKTEEELIWENYILLESFKDFKKKKLEEGIGEVKLGVYIEKYKMLKSKGIFKNQEGDISFWTKKPFNDFFNFVNNAQKQLEEYERSKPVKKFDVSEIKNDPNVELIYNGDKWVAFGVKNFEGAAKWGSQTTDWCITKDDGHYDNYTDGYVFVFVFDLTKEPYNIHTKDGDPDSKLAYRFDGDGDVTDIHNAPDDEVSGNQDLFETVYFDKIKEWAINNFDEVSGGSFDSAMEKAEEEIMLLNKEFKWGYIYADGEDKDSWSVSGTFTFDFTAFEFKEGLELGGFFESGDMKKIRDIFERHTEHHEIGDDIDNLTLYINPEYQYGRDFGGGNNPILDAVHEVESDINDLERDYYRNYYNIYFDLLDEGLIEDTDPISKFIGTYHTRNNHLVIIVGKSTYDYTNEARSKMVDDLDDYVRERYTELGGSLDRGGILDTDNLLTIGEFAYNKYGIGANIEVIKKFQQATHLMSSRDKPKIQEEKNLKAIYGILADSDRLKVDLFKMLNKYLTESKTSFKRVFYS